MILLIGNLILGEKMSAKISLELVNFKREMRRVEREVKRLANSELEDKIKYATRTLRVVTPVDTGEARAGWTSSYRKDFDGFVDGKIVNKVEHIDILNRGHSKQAPKYFIERVLMTIGILTPN